MKGKDLSEIDLQDQYLVGTLISLLGSDEKTTGIIRLLSKELTGKDSPQPLVEKTDFDFQVYASSMD